MSKVFHLVNFNIALSIEIFGQNEVVVIRKTLREEATVQEKVKTYDDFIQNLNVKALREITLL